MIVKICFTLVWFSLLVQCDHEFSKLIPVTDESSSLTDESSSLTDESSSRFDDSASLPISTEFDSDDWDEEDATLNRGFGSNPTYKGPTVVTPCGNYTGRYGGTSKGGYGGKGGKGGKGKGGYGGKGKGLKCEKFLGIRYALPPVRYQPPKSAECTPDTEIDATEFGPPCMQPKNKYLKGNKMEPSEDCLYLNIYRPAYANENDKYPVLIYVYESYFLYGSAAQPELNACILAAMGKIIVVTLNYRLGAYGWLNGDNPVIQGNMGGYDVVEAIKYVRKFIGYFGGDSNQKTCGGHGAGATICIGAMFNYNEDEKFIDGVMAMSGDYNLQSYYDSELICKQKSNAFLKLINCNDPPMPGHYSSDQKTQPFSPNETACAIAANTETLNHASDNIRFYDGNGICSRSQLFPCYNQSSLDDLLQRGMFRKDKYLYLGNVNTEFKKSLIGSKAKTKEEGAELICDKIPPVILDQRPENIQKIVKYYLGVIEKENPFEVGKRTTLAFNNLCYGCPTAELVKYFSRYNNVYAYQYSYVASCDKDDPKRIYGPYHLDDVPIGFGLPFLDYNKYDDYDREVSKALIDIWSDFVSEDKLPWPCYDKKDRFIGVIKGDEKSNYYITSPYTDICRRIDV